MSSGLWFLHRLRNQRSSRPPPQRLPLPPERLECASPTPAATGKNHLRAQRFARDVWTVLMRWSVSFPQYCRVSPTWLEPANGSSPVTSQKGEVSFCSSDGMFSLPGWLTRALIFRSVFGFGAERWRQQTGGALRTTCFTWIQRILPVRPLIPV